MLAVLALAGCGGGNEPAAVPAGFQQLDGPAYTFAHPSGWSRVETDDLLGAQGAKGTGGLEPQAVVGSQETSGGGLDIVINAFKTDAMTRRANWKVVREEQVDVDGAEDARLTEARYDEVAGRETTPVRTIDLHVMAEDGTLYDFLVRAPEADFDRLRLAEVIDTFRLK
jgi:hypothetical protein